MGPVRGAWRPWQLGTMPCRPDERAPFAPDGRTSRAMHLCSLVAGWQMGPCHVEGRRTLPHLAAAVSERQAGASHLRVDPGGGDRHVPRWPFLCNNGIARECLTVDSRCGG